MNFKNVFYFCVFSLLLQSCASGPSKNECATTDWKTAGFSDGAQGVAIENFDAREKTCNEQSVTVNKSEYMLGYQEGLKKYCTISHFFFRGEMGWGVQSNKCPKDLQNKLGKAFDQGKRLYNNKQRAQELEKQIGQIQNDKSFVADIGRAKNLLGGDSPTKNQEAELVALRKEIQIAEENSPDAAEFCEHEMQGKQQAQKMIPSFILNMSGKAEAFNGCSRSVK